jgi:hypothetical protein
MHVHKTFLFKLTFLWPLKKGLRNVQPVPLIYCAHKTGGNRSVETSPEEQKCQIRCAKHVNMYENYDPCIPTIL